MAAVESINQRVESILHSIEEISDKNISLIRDIETIEGKANEQDATQLIDSLKEHLKASQETNAQLQKTLQSQSTALKEDLEKLQKQHEAAEKGQMEPGELSNQEKELTLQLKSQMAKNVELQNGRLKTELALHERIEALKLMSQTNKRLQADVNTSRSNSQKLLKLFDKRAKEAERRLTEMEEELKRTQENAKKYQDLYETEKRKRQIKAKSDGEGDGSQDKQENNKEETEDKDDENERGKSREGSARLRASQKSSDLQRKYQFLLDENGILKDEIKRLKMENADLFKRAKEAGGSLQMLKSQVATSFAEREKLQKQLRKQKQEAHKSEKNKTKEVNVWVENKKEAHRKEEEYKWSQIGPISVLGAEKRTYSHPQPRQDDIPRNIPVEQWASPETDH